MNEERFLKMKKVIDLLFSIFFVFTSVFIGGIAIKSLYFGYYLEAIALFIAVLYLFGIGCMGLNRLRFYIRGKNQDESHEISRQ
jgi:hypothetical protein